MGGNEQMKASTLVALSLLAGSVIGGTAVQRLHAQASPPVYLVGEIEISDPEGYRRDYLPRAQALIRQHGGRAIAGGSPTTMVGEPPKSRVAIYAWDGMEQLMGWFNSPEYQEVRKIGERYAKYRNFAVPGVAQ
jgi:uncharacterized protein (DUF1330 family)